MDKGLNKALQLDISPQAREAIESFMRTSEPIAYGTESHALEDFRNWCIDMFKTPQLVVLRTGSSYTVSDRERAVKHYQDYFNNEPRVYSSQFEHYPWVTYNAHLFSRTNRERAVCEKYFHKHIGDLATYACIAKYGSVKAAFLKTSTWIELWNDFEDWFQGKRERFMAKQKTEIEKVLNKAELTKKKLPQSHGGVANLLKVLTKTMEQQGADITSIAKVQYAVATQAGIYIPSEFLTDVAVALDATGEL